MGRVPEGDFLMPQDPHCGNAGANGLSGAF